MPRGIAVLAVLLLAGCTSRPDAEAAPADAAPPMVTPDLLVVAEGTYKYHDLDPANPNTASVLEVYDVATHVAVNPCAWEGSAYFNNKQVPTRSGTFPGRNGNLTLQFDWTDADYPQPTLVAGYKAPGMDQVAETVRIHRGEPVVVPIHGRDDNRTEAGGWALFACVNPESDTAGDADWQPGLFIGSFTVHATFQGDPEPAAPPSNETGPQRRTSQG